MYNIDLRKTEKATASAIAERKEVKEHLEPEESGRKTIDTWQNDLRICWEVRTLFSAIAREVRNS